MAHVDINDLLAFTDLSVSEKQHFRKMEQRRQSAAIGAAAVATPQFLNISASDRRMQIELGLQQNQQNICHRCLPPELVLSNLT